MAARGQERLAVDGEFAGQLHAALDRISDETADGGARSGGRKIHSG